MARNNVPVFSGRGDGFDFVREVSIHYHGRGLKAQLEIRNPETAIALAQKCVKDDAREHFLALYVDARHRFIGRSTLSIGTATASLVHPREVFQLAVGLGACGAIVLHNHPSDDPAPSNEDREITKRLEEAGKLLGIELLDHIVWTRSGDSYSFRQEFPF